VRTLILLLALSLVSPLSAASKRRAVSPPLFPACRSVAGSPAVTFSRDGGQTAVPVDEKLSGIAYTFGLAFVGPATLLSAHNETLALSSDSGCTWRTLGTVGFSGSSTPTITPAGNGRAYLWTDNAALLAGYQSEQWTSLTPPADVVGLGVDSASGAHVRLGGANGSLWDSVDGGAGWSRLGAPPVSGTIVYRAAFDPASLDHVLFGTSSEGAFVTFDGGKTYVRPAGLAHGFNVFNLAVSPADPNVVWAEAYDLAADKKRIFLSRDGGRSFTGAVDEQPGVVTLVNGALLVPHPADANVLYFVFGTYFQNYGTDLFRYDAVTKALRTTHFDFNDIDAIAFSPFNPDVMYFGLEVVQGHQ
jgi:hypothetical protein